MVFLADGFSDGPIRKRRIGRDVPPDRANPLQTTDLPAYEADRYGDTESLDSAANVALHAVGHLHKAPPRVLDEAHHAVEIAIARQRPLGLALAVGGAWFHAILLGQRAVCLAG